MPAQPIRCAIPRHGGCPIRLLAETEGIFTEPAGGTTLAAAIELIRNGTIGPDESTVVCITGNGYKTLEAVTDSVPVPHEIGARLEEFDALYDELQTQAGIRRSA